MRILVIGQSGQVARSLAERAPHHPSRPELTFAGRPAVDLADRASLEAALDGGPFDLVINAAAYTAVDAAEDDEANAHAINAEGPGHLAALAAARDLPLIHISTDYVFDGEKAAPYGEDDPVKPQSAYGRTKAAGEAAIRAAGGRALIARTAWVYSPFGKNFVKTMMRLAETRPELNIVADQHGNPTNALDIADALLALGAKPESWPDQPDTIHCVAEGEASWHEFALAIFAAADVSPTVGAIATDQFPTPAKRPANSRLETAKMRDQYGVTLPHWRDSLPPVVARIKQDAGGGS